MIKATPSQQATLRRVCRYVNACEAMPANYEIKTWKVTPLSPDGDGTLALLVISGIKADVDPLDAILCRTMRHVFIGPKGGISAVIKGKIVKGDKALLLSRRNL